MKGTIVYAIISSEKDYYFEELLISLYTLRIHEPEANVVVLTDNKTVSNLIGHRKDIRKYVNKLQIIDIPEELTPVQRSRFLKVNIINNVEGDFLFIDSDTVIAGCLSEIEKYDGDIIAVQEGKDIDSSHRCIPYFKARGWGDCSGMKMLNSGVMYVRKNEKTIRLYNSWYNRWTESKTSRNCQDQPSLVKAISENPDIRISTIPDIYNCQIRTSNVYCIGDAKIIHPYAGLKDSIYKIYQQNIMEEVRAQGITNPELITMLEHPRSAFLHGVRLISMEDSYLLYSPIVGLLKKHNGLLKLLNNLITTLGRLKK